MFNFKSKESKQRELHSLLLEMRIEIDYLLEQFPFSANKLSYLDKQVDLYGNDMSVLHRIESYALQIKELSKVLFDIKNELIPPYKRKEIEKEIDFFKSESLYDIDYTILTICTPK